MGGVASTVAVPFSVRREARFGWLFASLATLGFAAALGWVLVGVRDGAPAFAALAFLGWIYWEAGVGSFKLAWHTGKVEVTGDALVVNHPFLLAEPITVPLGLIAGFAIDDRPESERRVAACTRRRAAGGPLFLEASLPVVSPHPSSHSRYGTAAAPNFVVLFTEEIEGPRVPRAARLLLRVAAGKSDRYRGPIPGKPMRGVRLLIEDPSALAKSLMQQGAEQVDQETYLRPLQTSEVRRYRRERLIYASIWVGVLLLVVLARFVGLQ